MTGNLGILESFPTHSHVPEVDVCVCLRTQAEESWRGSQTVLAAGCGDLCRERQSGPFHPHRDLPILSESLGWERAHTPHPVLQ